VPAPLFLCNSIPECLHLPACFQLLIINYPLLIKSPP
jgi:hypothetical protein